MTGKWLGFCRLVRSRRSQDKSSKKFPFGNGLLIAATGRRWQG